jgi:hypothetical protein
VALISECVISLFFFDKKYHLYLFTARAMAASIAATHRTRTLR